MFGSIPRQAEKVRAELLVEINLTKEQILEYTNKFSKERQFVTLAGSDLLDLWVDSTSGQKFNRLLTIPSQTWTRKDIRWANQIIEKLRELKASEAGDQATLALLCYGYSRKTIVPTLAELAAKNKKGRAKFNKEKKIAEKKAEAKLESELSMTVVPGDTNFDENEMMEAISQINEQAAELN